MDDRKIKSFKTFNKIMVNGILWFAAGILAYLAVDNCLRALQNDEGAELIIEVIMHLIMLGSAVLLVKASFDLRAMSYKGVKEILIAGMIATAIFIIELIAVDWLGGYREITFIYPLISFCWTIGVCRYYTLFQDKFTAY